MATVLSDIYEAHGDKYHFHCFSIKINQLYREFDHIQCSCALHSISEETESQKDMTKLLEITHVEV